MKFLGNLLIFCLCICCFPIQASIFTRNLSTSNGLISNKTQCLIDDAEGRLWVGTDGGISIYNGYNFKSFTIEDGLAGNDVRALVLDNKNSVWSASYNGGLTQFKNGKRIIWGKKFGLTDLKINVLFYYHNLFFIGSEKGLFVFDTATKKLKKILLNHKQTSISINRFLFWKNRLYGISNEKGLFIIQTKQNVPSLVEINPINHLLAIIPKENGFLVCKQTGVYKISKLTDSVSQLHTIGNQTILDWTNTSIGQLYLASWDKKSVGGGVFEYSNGSFKSWNIEYSINSQKITICHCLKNGLLAIGTENKGLFLVNPHFSNHGDFKLNNIKGEIKIGGTTYYFNEHQLIDKNGKVFFELNNIDFIKTYQKQQTQQRLLKQFKLENRDQHIRAIKFINNKIIIVSSAGILFLDKNFKTERILPILAINFQICNSTLFYQQVNFSLFIIPNIFNTKSINEQQIKGINSMVLSYQQLGEKVMIWTKQQGVFLWSKHHILQKQKVAFNQNLKKVSCWKKNFIFVTVQNEVYKGVIRNEKLYYSTIKLPISFKNIVAISTNGDNFVLQTDKGLIVYLVGTIRLFNQNNFLADKQISHAYVSGMHMVICTEKEVIMFPLYQLLGYYLPSPKIELTSSISKEIPYSQKSVVLSFEKIATLLPSNYEFYFQVNKGDTVPMNSDKIFLLNLSSGKYKVKVLIYNNYNGSWFTGNTIYFSKDLPIWTQWFFWLTLFIFMALIFLFFYMRRKLNNKRKEIRRKEIEQRISSLRLEAIRAKMNPHFMFNALNSIQNFVIDNDVDNALLYLSEFSKLMRQTLDFSSVEKISLEEEIDFLNRYMRIERMRFSSDINIVKEIDAEAYNYPIPPMILQPLIENAFLHGLLNDSDQPQTISLSICVKHNKVLENKVMELVISNSKEKQQSSKKKHNSFALKAIQERLYLNHPENSISFHETDTIFAVTILLIIND